MEELHSTRYQSGFFSLINVGSGFTACVVFKKGSKLDPNNYRMLAVNGTFCRLYANILREMVTKWCVENRKVPDTQFCFYPDCSTIKPMFVLGHLVHAAKQSKPKGCSHLHTVFIDL